MKISGDDLLDIGTGKQMLEDFIPKILCHSTKNEFAVGKQYALKKFNYSISILAIIALFFFFPIADTTKTVLVRNTHKKATISIIQKIKSRKKFKYNFKKSDFLSKAWDFYKWFFKYGQNNDENKIFFC